jgi:hypothetical protein
VNNVSGKAESHFRNVRVLGRTRDDRWPLVNLGGGPRLTPKTERGVPVYIHDYYSKGLHAKVVSTRAKDWKNDGNEYRPDPPLTGDESLAAAAKDVQFPQLLNPIDDQPPVTVVLAVRKVADKLVVEGVSHDDGEVESITVNGRLADIVSTTAGVADWRVELNEHSAERIIAVAKDNAGNSERTPHQLIAQTRQEPDAIARR